jgi:hypothetical protein
MIYHCIRYALDPHKLAAFEPDAHRWTQARIIHSCGGDPRGYFLPKNGLGAADNIAIARIGLEGLTADERRRKKLRDAPDARENAENAERSGCILVEDRPYFYRIDGSEVEKGP